MYFASKYIIQEYVMCAIMGILENNVNIEALKRMAKVLRHRGPDDTGEYMTRLFDAEDENVAVAHNRLSIRDLSSNGHQPMINDQGNVIITFNGEIYNAEDYRAELEKKGYTFKGTSDTEIMLNLYVEYGIDGLLERIDGMYAICIIDKKDDCIYLIRDRIGEKPLYFYKNANTLIWASEYKAFYEHPSFKVELDEDALSEYIMFRYVSGGHTLLRNVTNLEPGTYMQIKRGEIHKVKYWNYPVGNTSKNHYVDDVENWFKDRLRNAVNSRLVSDVEVGVQLSGGVDSSCITHMISEKRNELQTFGMVFGDRSYSEQKYMEKVVAVCNTKSHMYEFPNELFLKNWMMTTYFFEAPMNHEGTVALMHLNKKASEYVKVLLCGEGSDESLGGYKRFYDNLKERVDRVYKCRELIRKLIRRGTGDMDSLLNRYEKSFVRETQYTSNATAKKIYRNINTKKVLAKRNRMMKTTRGSGLRKLLNYELSTYCQDLLMRADKVSMASSIEVRVPFLMPGLIEDESCIQDKYLVDCKKKSIFGTKVILKWICQDLFGVEFTYREKRGFGIYLMDYFSQEYVKDYIINTLLPGIKKREILDYQAINKMYKKKCKNIYRGKTVSNDQVVNALWVAFSFEMWCQYYLDGNPNNRFNMGEIIRG